MSTITRRELLKRSAVLGAGVALSGPTLLRPSAAAAVQPRIVVVGGGLGGMTAAWRIHRRTGWDVQVFEAAHTVGGRTCTVYGLAGGQHAEGGAQGINTYDRATKQLVGELGLTLVDTWENWPGGGGAFYFNSQSRTKDEVKAGIKVAYDNAWRHFRQLPWPLTHRNATPSAQRWDRMSVAEWINRYVPGGRNSVLGNYVENYFEIEYAGPAEEASAIHLIVDYGWGDWPKGWDERYCVGEGNVQIVEQIEAGLPGGSVHTQMPLLALRTKPNGEKVCTFDDSGTPVDVVADRVVLALPFSALRDVDLSGAGLSPAKLRAINRLGIGNGVKHNFQFSSRPWQATGNGSSQSDLEPGMTWQAHAHQPGSQGLITGLNGTLWGGDYGSAWYHSSGSVPSGVADQYLSALGTVFGVSVAGAYNGYGYIHNWPANPWVKGSYSYYPAGRFTEIAGAERGEEEGIHFAGEHTAPYYRRVTIDGAVVSGERAAKEILRDLA